MMSTKFKRVSREGRKGLGSIRPDGALQWVRVGTINLDRASGTPGTYRKGEETH